MNSLKNLLAKSISGMLTILLIYIYLYAIKIEMAHLLLPGWHTTEMTGKPLLNTFLFTAIVISIISNVIYASLKSIIEKRK